MGTSEQECLAALREAAKELGKSPTKAEYEGLGLQPASATIIRTVGNWNGAKEKAGLETAPSTGSRTQPKPEDIELPDGTEWEDLSVDQRWHYRNVEWNTTRTLQRRARLRSWVSEQKAETGCERCGEANPACLDFHHRNPDDKEMAVGDMVTHGHGRERLSEEIAKCVVLCANCHRKEHHTQSVSDGRDDVRAWLREHKIESSGCRRCEENDHRCLVFHHQDEKTATVAELVANRRSLDAIRAEIQQCTLLCSNCHRREHYVAPEPDQ